MMYLDPTVAVATVAEAEEAIMTGKAVSLQY